MTAPSSPRAGSSARPWLAAYPPGATAEIDPSRHRNVLELIEETTLPHRDAVAFSCLGERRTFGDVLASARALSAWLLASGGIVRGDRVGVMLPNGLASPIALLGILGAGAVQVSINPQYTPHELAHQLQDSGARLLIAASSVLAVVQEAVGGTAVERLVVVAHDGAEAPGALHVTSFDAALAAGAALPDASMPTCGLHDLALLQYTGGTTGVSKGAELTHGNLVANVLQTRSMIHGLVCDGKETILTALPLYHIFALTVNCLTFMSFGARNLLIPNPRDADVLAAAFADGPVTVITGVNTLFGALLALPQLAHVDYRCVKFANGGGTAVQRAVSDAWQARSGRPIVEGYGLSETSPAATMNPFDRLTFSGTIGVPVPSTDIVILDDAGHILPAGAEGEICIKGPQVTRGYWRRPEATAAAFTSDGYFRSGDIGSMDERGFFRICDRKKDMVIVSGFNVYPNEVEDVIAAIPGVAECAVAGVPDERTGEAVAAFVVRRDRGLDAAAIVERCRRELTAYKVPKRIAFVEQLPKSAVGKILRRELRSRRDGASECMADVPDDRSCAAEVEAGITGLLPCDRNGSRA